MINVLIAYVAGTERMMRACLESIKRHDAGVDYRVVVISDNEAWDEAKELFGGEVGEVVSYSVDKSAIGSERHASLLDKYMRTAEGMVLTMDSDCMVVADGWLKELWSLYRPDHGLILPGIRWPWEPMKKPTDDIEGRVRSFHNWDRTWVACQLVDPGWIREKGLTYAGGDDTGFELANAAEEDGMQMHGWLPTRCALPDGELDPELNRMVCVVYGDKVVHIGGGSGEAVGRVVDVDGMYKDAIERVLEEQGAEWMLDEKESHKYAFDREDEVIEYKMMIMYSEMRRYLQTHDSLFRS